VPSASAEGAADEVAIDAATLEFPGWGDAIVATHPAGEVTAAELGEAIETEGRFSLWATDHAHAMAGARDRARRIALSAWQEAAPMPPLDSPVAFAAAWSRHAEARTSAQRLFARQPLPEDVAVSDSEVETFYQEHLEEFMSPARVSFQYLFLEHDDEGAAAAKAADLAAQLQADPLAFNALAAEHSQASMTDKTMTIGPVERTTMLPPMAEALFDRLETGQISDAIELSNGYVIVKLISRAEAAERNRAGSLANVRLRLEAERRQRILDEAIMRFRVQFPFALMRENPATPDTATEAAVINVAGRTVSDREMMSFLVFEGRYGGTPEAWRSAAEAAYGVVIETIALESLCGEADLEAIHAERAEATDNWARSMQAAIDYAPLEESQLLSSREALLASIASHSIVEGRVLYVRPGDRPDEDRKIVPRSEVIAELQAALTAIDGGMAFEEAVRTYSTAPDAAAGGGVVRSDDPELPVEIANALRAGELGQVSAMIGLPNGYCLVLPEHRLTPFPADLAEIDWMTVPYALRTRGSAIRRGVQLAYQRDDVKVDEVALATFAGLVELRQQIEKAKAAAEGEDVPSGPGWINETLDRAVAPAPAANGGTLIHLRNDGQMHSGSELLKAPATGGEPEAEDPAAGASGGGGDDQISNESGNE
jgi:parvulin-like peptidyl-prolyl isomerase